MSDSDPPPDSGPGLLLVGAGHAHLQVLEAHGRERYPGRAPVTVVAPDARWTYSGMVPGYLAGQYELAELQVDVGALAETVGAEFVRDRAVTIDPGARRVGLASGREVPYRIASFDIGGVPAGLDVPGVRDHALPFRPLARFLRRIESRPSGGPARIVVVGGGAGGMELAFALERRFGGAGGDGGAGVTVIEAGPEIVADAPALARRLARHAGERGITLRTGERAVSVREDAVETSGGSVPYGVLVWTVGVTGHAIFRDGGLPVDESDFVRVRSTLQVEGHDALFAAGDCAALIDHPHTPKAGVFAVRQGPTLARNLRAALTGDAPAPYRPQADYLRVLNLGDGRAVAHKWGIGVEGRWVMKVKDWLDRRFVERFG